ncbi:hypothetical protein SXCC_02282 [Gluconacetobacter sp. SXCC-1]|nr:hypothetical protein SXCC_02282 [Gluconacetobacter sp. SXCC-1]
MRGATPIRELIPAFSGMDCAIAGTDMHRASPSIAIFLFFIGNYFLFINKIPVCTVHAITPAWMATRWFPLRAAHGPQGMEGGTLSGSA